ncbi:MAG TPA: molybdopterin-dependent oxidoreductase [Ilumatobacter sp.]|nr:molybdopterin-dependent oxidoreductase [Ilumatobacter sp.]
MRTGRLTPRQVDVVLEVLLLGAVASGLTSWAIGTSWAKAATAIHAVCGFTILVMAGAKLRGSVRVGMRRGRASRWLSVGFGLLVLVTISLGVAHTTGLWFGVGYWSSLWTHFLVAFALLPLLLWHIFSRPARPKLTDLDRRAVLRAGSALAIGTVVYGAQEVVVRVAGLAGAARRATGSHELGSLQPSRMPTVSWINDEAPTSTDPANWSLDVFGKRLDVAGLARLTTPVVAVLDCTGGWWSEQSWDAVPLRALVGDDSARSINVASVTGYSRLYPFSDIDQLYLAVGYGGQPLRRGHGAPVRVVAPGRRGPWWIKWVTSVQLDDRPSWLQTPFPLE